MESMQSGQLSFARAIIKENSDPEKRGRVKVEYPWFQGDAAQMPSEWARICQPYASKESGSWFLPDKGDEVLVYFEGGNLEFPIIMGSLYSEKNAPPKSGRAGDLNDNEKNDLKYIRTRSGHLLCFDDSSDNAGIVLKDPDNRAIEIKSKDNQISMNDGKGNQVTIEGPKISIKNKGGNSITLENGSITIHSAGSIKLGKSALYGLIKGEAFQAFFNTHTHMTAWGPSSPPIMPMNPTLISSTSKTV